MNTRLDIRKKDDLLYVPEKTIIKKIEQFTQFEKFFQLELESGKTLGHKHGQFVQV